MIAREPVRGHLPSRLGVAVLKALSRLPLPVLRPLGRGLGTLVWWLATSRRRITLINLGLCLPELDESARRRLGRQHFQWYLCSILERFILWTGAPERIRSLVQLEGMEHFEAVKGRPLILLAPHFVGMDAGGMRMSMDRPVAVYYSHQSNPVLDAEVYAGRMRFPGAVAVPRSQTVRTVVRLLRDGLPLHFSPDMDLGPRDSIFVPFFGIQTATVTATARLAQLSGAAVLPFVSVMTPEGYVARFYPAWTHAPGDDLEDATRRLNAFIEDRVRETPAQYLWSHRRFKTRPPGEPDPYRRTA
jgi:KDO2-lipid IV(A) lauroyltransferase